MRTLAERLIGKHLKGIDTAKPELSVGVLFTDNTGITVYSSVAASINSLANASQVEAVTIREKELELHLSGGGYVRISTDWDQHSAVEAYVFQDVDGTYVVENGN